MGIYYKGCAINLLSINHRICSFVFKLLGITSFETEVIIHTSNYYRKRNVILNCLYRLL